MPTLVRAATDERDGLLAFLEEQRASLRRAVHGLTDEQAAARPTVSGPCLGGVIKHVTAAERNWVDVLAGRPSPERDWDAEFRVLDGETLDGLVEAYRAQARDTESVVSGVADLGAPLDISPLSSLLPEGTVRTPRWVLSHLIQETARHAGHADILRETLDGATAYQLIEATGTPILG
ncbi:DinB family protein [Saccharopolyspora rosea]|uniref:DinB family protein n=1 Tax=Saccharopolyspora rosea TaxID=524884 RepID=UPI0021D9CC52|nr:DinB family protein [Saccharopolyspora rosea]